MRVLRRLFGLGAAAAALMAAGCEDPAPAADLPPAIDNSAVAAMVNGEPVYVSDVLIEAELQGVIEEGGDLPYDSAEFGDVLKGLVDLKLIAQEAEARGLDEEPAGRHRLQAAREQVLLSLLMEVVVAENIDEAAVRKMYDEQIEMWQPGNEYRVRQIVTATKEEIDAVLEDLSNGAEFAVLAAERSIDETTRLEGGDLGYLSEDEVTPAFRLAIENTATGGVSQPFETFSGWRVLKVEERRKEEPPSLEELRGPILEHLETLEIRELLAQLRSEARVEHMAAPRNSTLDVSPFDLAPGQASSPQIEASGSGAEDAQ